MFENQSKELVGFDIEMAHLLAQSLDVQPEFYLLDLDRLPGLIAEGTIDIAMTGLAITPERAAAMRLSNSYMDETLAFVVRDHLRNEFTTWAKIRELKSIQISVPNVSYYIKEVQARLPDLPIFVIDDPERIVENLGSSEAVAMPAERGSILTFLHPEYSSVVPGPDIARVPLPYPLSRDDQDWAHFINTWIELKQKDGTVDRIYKHWILGQGAVKIEPRWSIMRNVLEWTMDDGRLTIDDGKRDWSFCRAEAGRVELSTG